MKIEVCLTVYTSIKYKKELYFFKSEDFKEFIDKILDKIVHKIFKILFLYYSFICDLYWNGRVIFYRRITVFTQSLYKK